MNPFVVSELIKSNPGYGKGFLALGTLSVFPDVPVSSEESIRSGSMKHSSARARFLAGRRLLRGILSQWTAVTPEKIPLSFGVSGKPFLDGAEDVFFSIAHSGSLVGVLLAPCECGLDLEFERPVDVLPFARRFFSPEEAARLQTSALPTDFFTLWTCREAAIKADGRGMAALLAGTRASAVEQGRCCVDAGGRSWAVVHRRVEDPGGDCHLAAAFREPTGVILWCDLR